jgi:hypothetical protein
LIYNIDKLNKLYGDADAADKETFSHQRSNVLLISGEHYTKRNTKFWNRIRDNKDISGDQKLRLTKNHIQKITKSYINNIISQSPSVKIVPQNEKELNHQKAAELANSVWQHARSKHNLRKKTQQWAKDFIDLGEFAVKIYFDPNAGKFLGYEAETDEAGNPVMDDGGQMVASKTPRFQGDVVFERVFAFNLLRDPAAKNMDESKVFIIRKMVDVEALRAMVKDDEEKSKKIQETMDGTFVVFDGEEYKKSEGQALLKEFYFRPSVEFPMGYFYITCESVILFEGELPFGIFPIVYEGFDEVQTSPRHSSIVKILRPYQAEINRGASQQATHQVTLGDDKLITQSGTKVTTGVHLPGVRSIQVSGMAPTVLPGRTGDHFMASINANIAEMYQVANMNEDAMMKEMKSDPFGALFMSIRDKKRFVIYVEKFSGALEEICKIHSKLCKNYLKDEDLIPMIGKNEFVNIAEFRNIPESYCDVKTEPMSDDVETMMGKQLAINHTLQYVGAQLDKKDIGRLIRSMPLGNMEESFSDLTLDYDAGTNIILSLDRGEAPQPFRYDEGSYLIKRLVARTRMSDFKLLDQGIQSNYFNLISLYEQQETEKQQEILKANADFIPSSGARVKVDYYIADPKNPDRPVRATLPAEAVDWLIKRLADQGSSQEIISQMNTGAVSEMAGMLNQKLGMATQGSAGGPPIPPTEQGGQRMLQ